MCLGPLFVHAVKRHRFRGAFHTGFTGLCGLGCGLHVDEIVQVVGGIGFNLIHQNKGGPVAALLGIFQNIFIHAALLHPGEDVLLQRLLDGLLFSGGFGRTKLILHVQADGIASGQQNGEKSADRRRKRPASCPFFHRFPPAFPP